MGQASYPQEAREGVSRQLWCGLFGVHLVSDVHERACDLGLALPLGAKRRRRLERIREAGLLFVHVPKAAGMSISAALYGDQIKHASIRLSRHLDPALRTLPSFAVLRDPAERFLSAYRYARVGGSANNEVAEPFRTLYRDFRSIDDALDHVAAAKGPYAVDHIFRPQRWYVTDRKGRVAVDRLIAMEEIARLPLLVPGFPSAPLPELNRSAPTHAESLTRAQIARLRGLYAGDYWLWAGIGQRMRAERPSERPALVGIEPLLAM
ncbi:MAG: hypothetical protein JWO65_238 [Sphingomonas bacterium]|nr:hypothetical protein [Sphingomonas bacterium]